MGSNVVQNLSSAQEVLHSPDRLLTTVQRHKL